MEYLKIRDDKMDFLRYYNCENCNRTPVENSVIIETEINYERLIFCSEECILNYLKGLEDDNDILIRKQIKIYKQTPADKLGKEILKMKPNSRKILENGWSIDYFKVDSLVEHYILNTNKYRKLFTSVNELAQFIAK